MDNFSPHRAQVLSGDNVWGPMALSDGKLVLRDWTKIVCIEIGHRDTSRSEPGPAPTPPLPLESQSTP